MFLFLYVCVGRGGFSIGSQMGLATGFGFESAGGDSSGCIRMCVGVPSGPLKHEIIEKSMKSHGQQLINKLL